MRVTISVVVAGTLVRIRKFGVVAIITIVVVRLSIVFLRNRRQGSASPLLQRWTAEVIDPGKDNQADNDHLSVVGLSLFRANVHAEYANGR